VTEPIRQTVSPITRTISEVGNRLQQAGPSPTITGTTQRLQPPSGSSPRPGQAGPAAGGPLQGIRNTVNRVTGGASGGGSGALVGVLPGGGTVPAGGANGGPPPAFGGSTFTAVGGGTYLDVTAADQGLRWLNIDPAGMSTAELAAAVAALSGCFYALPAREQRVLALRGGLGGRQPLSRRAVARLLGLQPQSVRALEIRGVRGLQAAAASDGCAGSPGATAMASGVGLISPLVATLTEPLRPLSATGGGAVGGADGFSAPALAGPAVGRAFLDGERVRWEVLAPVLLALGILSGLWLLVGGASRDERELRRRGRPFPARPLRAHPASRANGATANGAAERASAYRSRTSGVRSSEAPAEREESVRVEGTAGRAERRGAGVGRRTAA
jgi:hypothetical protein